MTVCWQALAASGEVAEPWREARHLDRCLIDTFEAVGSFPLTR